MITKKKLEIFMKYDGEIDGFIISGTVTEKKLITDEEWRTIDSLLQRINVMRAGSAAKSFEAETRRILETNLDAEAIRLLWNI